MSETSCIELVITLVNPRVTFWSVALEQDSSISSCGSTVPLAIKRWIATHAHRFEGSPQDIAERIRLRFHEDGATMNALTAGLVKMTTTSAT